MPVAARGLEKFTEVYMDFYPVLLATALKKIANMDEAEDICQEVFSILFEKIDEVENHKSWLLGTLKNVTLRYYQSRKKDTTDIEEHFEDDNLAYVNGFRDTRILLKEAVEAAGCSPEESVLLDLVAVHKFSYKNAAGMMGITRRQCEYMYTQLVKRIMEFLQKKGIKDLEELL